MQTSINGTNLIKQFEGLSLKAYLCPTGHWTIGWGSTFDLVGRAVTAQTPSITVEQAEQLLGYQIARTEALLNSHLPTGVRLNQNQYDALVSFTYNLGYGWMTNGSGMYLKLSANCLSCVAAKILEYDQGHVNGVQVTIPGLTVRRQAERRLFLS